MRRCRHSRIEHSAEVAAAQHGIFTIADALRASAVTKRQVDRPRRLDAGRYVYDGVYRVAGAPATWRGRSASGGLRGRRRRRDLPPLGRRALRTAGRPPTIWSSSPASAGSARFSPDSSCTRADASSRATSNWSTASRSPRPERVILDLASAVPRPTTSSSSIQAARRKRLITYESTSADVRPARPPRPQGRPRTA